MRLCNERQQVKNVKLFPNCTSSQQRLKPFFYFLFFLQCTMCECFMSAYAACVCHKDGWMIDFFFFLCRWTPYMNLYLGKGMESSFFKFLSNVSEVFKVNNNNQVFCWKNFSDLYSYSILSAWCNNSMFLTKKNKQKKKEDAAFL